MCKSAETARELYLSGYNCAQSVVGAFDAETEIDREILLRMASGLGGGVAGMKEICGAVNGMMLAAGLAKGSGEVLGADGKKAFNSKLAVAGSAFEREFGCLRCGDLLAAKAESMPQRDYCASLVYKAAELADGLIKEK